MNDYFIDFVADFHAVHDGSPIVGDGDVSVGGYEDFVHSFGTEGGSHDLGDGFGCDDVGFGGLEAFHSRLCLLLFQDDEGASVFICESLSLVGWRKWWRNGRHWMRKRYFWIGR